MLYPSARGCVLHCFLLCFLPSSSDGSPTFCERFWDQKQGYIG